jgi:hypothetical protein
MASNGEAESSTGGMASPIHLSFLSVLSRLPADAILLDNYRANVRLVDPH